MAALSGRNLRNRARLSHPRPSSLSGASAPFALGGSVLEERLSTLVVFEIRRDGNTEYSTMTLRALYNYVVSTITETCRAANNLRHTMKGQPAGEEDDGGGGSNVRRASMDNMHRQSISSYQSHGHGARVRAGSASDASGGRVEEESSSSRIGRKTFNRIGANSIGANTSSFVRHDSIDEGGADAGPDAAAASLSEEAVRTPSSATDGMPPHLPSLDTSKNSSHATPPQSGPPEGHRPTNNNRRHTRTPTGAGPLGLSPTNAGVGGLQQQQALPNAHRERLGGYLHPRDMRRLVTPFSSSNEPQLIVRRHVMLLNFDPLRAIVLRDRLLVLVPDGADSILIELERRVRGGIAEMEDQVFGRDSSVAGGNPPPVVQSACTGGGGDQTGDSSNGKGAGGTGEEGAELFVFVPESVNWPSHDGVGSAEAGANDDGGPAERPTLHHSNHVGDAGWEDMTELRHEDMPFELQSVDAVLETVASMLREDARLCHNRSFAAMYELRSDSPGDHAQERLRLHKDEVKAMEARVQGFVRAMNDVLDEDEDLALSSWSTSWLTRSGSSSR